MATVRHTAAGGSAAGCSRLEPHHNESRVTSPQHSSIEPRLESSPCRFSNTSARTADASSRRLSPATESPHVPHARAPISTNCCLGRGWSAPASRRAEAPASRRLAAAAPAVRAARAARTRTDGRKPNHSPRRNSGQSSSLLAGQKCPRRSLRRQVSADVSRPKPRAREPRISFTHVLVFFTYVLTRRSQSDHRQGHQHGQGRCRRGRVQRRRALGTRWANSTITANLVQYDRQVSVTVRFGTKSATATTRDFDDAVAEDDGRRSDEAGAGSA